MERWRERGRGERGMSDKKSEVEREYQADFLHLVSPHQSI